MTRKMLYLVAGLVLALFTTVLTVAFVIDDASSVDDEYPIVALAAEPPTLAAVPIQPVIQVSVRVTCPFSIGVNCVETWACPAGLSPGAINRYSEPYNLVNAGFRTASRSTHCVFLRTEVLASPTPTPTSTAAPNPTVCTDGQVPRIVSGRPVCVITPGFTG